MRLADLVAELPGVEEWLGSDAVVGGICADSRKLLPGDVFVAIPGLHVDGHRFVGQAVRAGAAAVIGERSPEALQGRPGRDFVYVRVGNARAAWGWSCAVWEGLPSRELTLIGVTGTDGKTTTVGLIHSMLRTAGIRAGMISTVRAVIPGGADRGHGDGPVEEWQEVETGLHTTTPDPPEIQRWLAEMVGRGATHAVVEVTSHGLAQHRVAGCDFDVAAVTNITHEHLDFHGSLEAYQAAKARLFAGLTDSYRKPGVEKVAVLNRDDGSFEYLGVYPADRRITYSVEEEADVRAADVSLETDGTQFTLCTPKGRVEIETSLVGVYNVANVLAAASVGVGLGLALPMIAEGVARLSGVRGRMERVDEGQPFTAIVDFAHTPNALRRALEAARGTTDQGGCVIVVFGSAGLRDREKRRLMGQIAGQLADVVIVTAEDPRTESLDAIMAESARAAEAEGKRRGVDVFVVADRGEAILRGCEMADAGDCVIACGKGHEQSMCFGTTEYPWDDRKAMRLALHGEALGTLPTSTEGDADQGGKERQ